MSDKFDEMAEEIAFNLGQKIIIAAKLREVHNAAVDACIVAAFEERAGQYLIDALRALKRGARK